MLFCIGSSFGRKLSTGNSDCIECLDQLLYSRKRGRILLYAEPNTINLIEKYLESKKDFDKLNLIKTISKKIRQKKQLLKDLTRFFVITCAQNIKTPREKGRAIFISPNFVNTSQVLLPPILLGENLTDCEFYANKISKNFTKGIPESLYEIKLSNRFEPGGGNSTHASYRRHKDNMQDLCFCIVDSDRRYPEESLGDTAKFVVAVDKEKTSSMCKNLVIDMYSAENLLPIYEIERQFVTGKSNQQIQQFSTTKELRKTESWKYLPLKKGFQGKDLKSDSGSAKYWSQQLNKIGLAFPCCDIPTCNCSLVPSISDKTLVTALSSELSWASYLNNEENPLLQMDYALISKELRSWLCIGTEIRS